jgi:lauroyl-Kdo2-lipid IVA myristoyltransferase
MGRWSRRPRQRATVNLCYCFPHWSTVQREQVIDQMFSTAAQVMVAIAELAVRSPSYLLRRIRISGREHLEQAQQLGHSVIFMVPHGLGIDVAAVTLAAAGLPMAAMFKPHPDPWVDWLWNRIRLRFGGRLHPRQQGLKPFIQSVRSGYVGYYLPDQDHGAEKSEFVEFFATYKATLPLLIPLAKACRACVLPLFPVYKAREGIFELQLRPALEVPLDLDPAAAARRMNQEIEALVLPHPEQYLWVLKLLKTRKPGEPIPYH